MRAVQMTAVGGPQVLRLAEVPEPRLAGDRDVKVRLAAAPCPGGRSGHRQGRPHDGLLAPLPGSAARAG